jgi:hypothetical protein
MTTLDFVVKKVYPGTPNQKNAGIYATFGIDIVVDEAVIASLADYKLCKSREGEMYIQSPYREYEKKGDQSGAKQKIYFAKLFPNDRDTTHLKAIIEQVKRACEQGGSAPAPKSGGQGGYKKYGGGGQRGNYTPQQQKPAPASNTDDW